MFKAARKRVVLWPVTIQTARDDGSGEVDEHEIKVRYELASRTEIKTLSRMNEEKGDAALAKKIKGWADVADEDGNALEFTQENLSACMDLPEFAEAVTIGFFQASRGARAKNS